MPAEVVACPACQNSVRVPSSLFGQPVRCPSCKAFFVAPAPDEQGIFGQPELLADQPVAPAMPNGDGLETKRSLLLPAILLLLVGNCGLILNGTVVFAFTYRMDQMIEAFKKAIEDPNINKQEVNGRKLTVDDVKEENFVQIRDISLIFLGISLVTCIGAIGMLIGRGYGLALLGSGLAIVNVNGCCCLFGLPVGIYCLVKLLDPEVRMLFRNP